MDKQLKWILTIGTVCILIASSFLILLTLDLEDKEEPTPLESIIIDDTISPSNVTQGLFLEVKRIHKKGPTS